MADRVSGGQHRRWSRVAGGMACAIAALVSVPAMASPSTMGDDRSIFQPAPTGLAAGGRGFKLTATLDTLYDGNMLRQGDGFTPLPGQEKADFRISPAVSGEIGLPFGRQRIYLNGTFGRDYYVRNEQLDQDRYQLGGGLQLAAGSACTALIDGDIGSRQIFVSEVEGLVPNAQETLTYGATASCQAAAGIGFSGSIRRTEVRNDNPTREFFDLNGTAYSLGISYAAPGVGLFSATGAINNITYIERPVLSTDGDLRDDGIQVISARLGFEREIGARLSLDLGLSYFEGKPEPTTVLTAIASGLPPVVTLVPVDRENFSGLGYDASITYRPNQRTTVILAGNRSATAAVNIGALAQIRNSILLDVDYMLGAGLRLGVGGSYDQRDYENSVLNLPDRGRRREQDKISRLYANIGYDISRLLTLGFEVAYQDRRSLPVEFSFDSFAASLNLRVRFGRNG
jgi:hypothetical protein